MPNFGSGRQNAVISWMIHMHANSQCFAFLMWLFKMLLYQLSPSPLGLSVYVTGAILSVFFYINFVQLSIKQTWKLFWYNYICCRLIYSLSNICFKCYYLNLLHFNWYIVSCIYGIQCTMCSNQIMVISISIILNVHNFFVIAIFTPLSFSYLEIFNKLLLTHSTLLQYSRTYSSCLI